MENENQTDLEEVINEVENETPQVEEVAEERPELDLEKFDSKDDPDVIKIDLSKPLTNETEESNTDDTGVVGSDEDTATSQSEDEVQSEGETQEEAPVLEEVTDEDTVTKEEVMEALDESEATGKPLPENIQKLVDFMEETGGNLEDYVRLNRDTSGLDDQQVLREYYERTKPHLASDEIDFLIEDRFSFDEEMDDDRDIKRKKLALKEQVAEAKTYLDGQKSKYYEDIKAGSKLSPEQQKAIDFFNRYNRESEQTKRQTERLNSTFTKETEKVFNDKFKGFEYNVGEKRYRFNVKDVDQVKKSQSNMDGYFRKFLNDDNTMKDAKGYHKSLYTAMNADAIAQHFYEQGKADALKENIKTSKNIDMNPRGSHNEIETEGVKFKVLGDDVGSFKFKMKNRK
jgi:hypothetical protein